MIDLEDFYRALARIRPLPDDAQRSAIEAPATAGLFIVAGPGSGKTTCLTLRMLKLMMVDDVPPRGILSTTFTVKAAEELRSRLLGWGFQLIDKLKADVEVSAEAKVKLGDLDINQVWTGTLDSLCEQLLRDYRAPGTHPPVLADEFVGRTLLLRSGLLNASRHQDVALDQLLLDLHGGSRFGFHVGTKAGLIQSLWDRRFQDLVNWPDFQANGPAAQKAARTVLAAALDDYEKALAERHMVDFALLEFEVLKRLQAGQMSEFTHDLRVVLVDEYQDTNLLQEQIYFEFAKACNGALAVVGDDDQSLYRFRGATVNLFRNFEDSYKRVFKVKPRAVYLAVNYRSTQNIVAFVNHFAELDEGRRLMRADGHRNANGCGLFGVHPGMVGDRENDIDRTVFSLDMPLEHATLKDLSDAIGRDKAEPASPVRPDLFGSAVPPVHHIVALFGHIRICGPERFDVAITLKLANLPPTAERWIPDDEVCGGPGRHPRIHICVGLGPCGIVRDHLAGDRALLVGLTVPSRDGLPFIVAQQIDIVPREHSVATFDVPEVLKHRRRRRHTLAVRPKVPLKVADPQDQLRDLLTPRLDLDSAEIAGRDPDQLLLLLAQLHQ